MSNGRDSPVRPRSKFPSFRRVPRPAQDDALRAVAHPTAGPGPSAIPNVQTQPRSHPPVLKINRFDAAPLVCKAHEGKVAARDRFDTMVITSPNMDYVPEYPIESTMIDTYSDGRWGVHEYSLWPQDLVPNMWHIACIPNTSRGDELPPVLWETLLPQTHWQEDRSIGFNGIGYIVDDTRNALVKAAAVATRTLERTDVPEDISKYRRFLVMVLRQVVDRMRHLPVVPAIAIAVAAHVQRLCLELAGLRTYIEVVVPRLQSDGDYGQHVLPVVGAFVRNGSDAQNCARVGIPTWFLQPLTHELPVWAVVETRRMVSGTVQSKSDPPLFHQAAKTQAVGNLTANWLSSMVLAVSKQVSGTHLAPLAFPAAPQIPETKSSMKRVQNEEGEMPSKRIAMPVAAASASGVEKKSRRGRKRGKGAGVDDGTQAPIATEIQQPSRSFTPSPFYDIAPVWASALQAVSPLPRSLVSALYFFPPPFLLDTVSSVVGLSTDGDRSELVRKDEKVHRYLHNLVRIREFCRTRLFDPSLSNDPLSITEWRAALWGDYQPKADVGQRSGPSADARRAQRRQDERNAVRRLFGRVARLRSYSEDEIVRFGEYQVDLPLIATSCDLRRRLLWEAHEINFRAELMALDTVLVQKSTWLEMLRWQREAVVTTVWGPPSSVVSVIPEGDPSQNRFGWFSPPGEEWTQCRDTLRNFITLLSRWPDCPDELAMVSDLDFSEEEFIRLQRSAINFYVRTFVKTFSRLPIPPISLSRP